MALLQHASLEIRSHDKFSLICGLVGLDTHIIQVFSPDSIAYTDNPAASRLSYVSPTDIVYRQPHYVRHPPYSVDLRFTAAPTRSNFSVTLRAWLLGEDLVIIGCFCFDSLSDCLLTLCCACFPVTGVASPNRTWIPLPTLLWRVITWAKNGTRTHDLDLGRVLFYQLNYLRTIVTSRLSYVSPADIMYRQPHYVCHPPVLVDPRFNASSTRSNFSVTLRTWLLGEDHFIIKCLQYVKEPFVFVLFELFIVPFNVYI